jgi:hypothetical protein
VIVWISLDTDRKKLDDFIAKEQLAGPHIYDGKGWEADLAKKFNINFTPSSYLLDRDGRIVAKHKRDKGLAQAVAALVKGQTLPEEKAGGGN